MFQKIKEICLITICGVALSFSVISCNRQQNIFVESPAQDMNLTAVELGPGWSLVADSKEQDADLEFPEVAEATSWNMRAFIKGEDQNLMSIVLVFPSVVEAQEGMNGGLVEEFKKMPKTVAETLVKIESELTGNQGASETITLQEENVTELGDEAIATWVNGYLGSTLILRKANVIVVITGSESKEPITNYARQLAAKVN